MTIRFKKVTKKSVKENYPAWHHKKAHFYAIVEDGEEKALLGIKRLTGENVEVSLLVFDEQQSTFMTRHKIEEILEFVTSHPCKRVIVGTEHRNLKEILRRLGFYYLVKHGQKEWFITEKEEER